jgi:hypothetical protein
MKVHQINFLTMAGSVLLCWALLAGCTGAPVQERNTSGIDVGDVTEITVENINGSLEIVTGSAGRLQADVTKFAPADQAAALAALDFTFSADGERVRAASIWGEDAPPESDMGMNVKLTVPASARLTVRNGNGPIRYDGLPGGTLLALTTGSGDITIELPVGVTFRVKALTANGSIETNYPLAPSRTDAGAALDGMLGNDPVLQIEATTGNGKIILERTP